MPVSNYASFATTAVTLAGTRYMKKLREIHERVAESGESDFNSVLAATYLRGLCDMSILCVKASNSKDMKACIEEIDAKVMEYESGAYERDGDEAAEDIRES